MQSALHESLEKAAAVLPQGGSDVVLKEMLANMAAESCGGGGSGNLSDLSTIGMSFTASESRRSLWRSFERGAPPGAPQSPLIASEEVRDAFRS